MDRYEFRFGRAAVLFVVCLLLAGVTLGQRGNPGGGKGGGNGGGNTRPNPLEVMYAFCSPGDSACETSNRVRMDRNEPYVDGVDGVEAWINAGVSGDLLLQMGSRQVTYDFRDIVNYGAPQPAWWSSTPVLTLTAGANVGNAWAAKEMCGDEPVCDTIYITRMNGGGWNTGRNTPNNRLQWNPYSIQPYINTPDGTSPVQVRYIKDASGEMFVITPLLNANGHYLAGLQAEERKSITAAGQYNMPFILIARPKP